MLPSSKRPPRSNDEVIRTGDFEVIQGTPSAGRRAGERARAEQPSVSDEDQTLLFSGSTRSMLPPRPGAPVATPSMRAPRAPDLSLRGLVREGREKPAMQERTNLRGSVRARPDSEDRTILRPMSTVAPGGKLVSRQEPQPRQKPPPRPPSARPPAMMPTPYPSMKPMPVTSIAPVALSINAPGGSDSRKPAPSDPHGDPPSAVITAKTHIGRPPSRFSLAAGLVALGAVVGLVTAVVARGDADSIIDATASFVDPSHGTPERANAASAQAAVLPAFLEPSRSAPPGTDKSPGACLDLGASTVSAPVVLNAPPAAPRSASLQGADPTTASRPAPPRPAPVAYAAPARPSPRPSAPAPVQGGGGSTSGGWLANITPTGAGAPITRPSKAAKGGSDFEGAAAADALAKAQLEASLR